MMALPALGPWRAPQAALLGPGATHASRHRISSGIGPMQAKPGTKLALKGTHRDLAWFSVCCLPGSQDKAAVETAIKEAEDKCASGTSGECAAAWDNVSCCSAFGCGETGWVSLRDRCLPVNGSSAAACSSLTMCSSPSCVIPAG